MRYLVTTKESYEPFFTDWFDCENNFNSELEMIVYDLLKMEYTTDGIKWNIIKTDNL